MACAETKSVLKTGLVTCEKYTEFLFSTTVSSLSYIVTGSVSIVQNYNIVNYLLMVRHL